jgi:hypothetical protein
MEIHLKIKDVVGMDDQKRHILRVDVEEVKRILQERKLWNELLDDPALRNSIYLQEKARRESSADHRERRRLFEIDKRRRQDEAIQADKDDLAELERAMPQIKNRKQ